MVTLKTIVTGNKTKSQQINIKQILLNFSTTLQLEVHAWPSNAVINNIRSHSLV